jgi:hypothetical protein
MRLAIHLRQLLHKRETASLVHESRTHNQEDRRVAVVLLSIIPVTPSVLRANKSLNHIMSTMFMYYCMWQNEKLNFVALILNFSSNLFLVQIFSSTAQLTIVSNSISCYSSSS